MHSNLIMMTRHFRVLLNKIIILKTEQINPGGLCFTTTSGMRACASDKNDDNSKFQQWSNNRNNRYVYFKSNNTNNCMSNTNSTNNTFQQQSYELYPQHMEMQMHMYPQQMHNNNHNKHLSHNCSNGTSTGINATTTTQ